VLGDAIGGDGNQHPAVAVEEVDRGGLGADEPRDLPGYLTERLREIRFRGGSIGGPIE
jgi:hypothetical protein